MFSIMAAPALDALLATLGSRVAHAEDLAPLLGEPSPLALGWPAFDAMLPDGGFPRGVIELASPRALGGATSVACAAICAAQRQDARAWCAWIDPEATIHAPGLAALGVDLARLLVVRPNREDLPRIAVKVAGARAFDVIAIDMDPILGANPAPSRVRSSSAKTRRPIAPEVLVRKLALLAEEGGARILLVSDRTLPRPAPWPVALRLELERSFETLTVRVAKDRRGRIGPKKTMPLTDFAPDHRRYA
jgi:recombination protein RecA